MILFYVERFEGVARREDGTTERVKRFVQRPPGRRAGPGCMNGVRRTLYNLPDVLRAVQDGERIYIVEGEKDADVLNVSLREEIGAGVATTSPGGAGAWYQSIDEYRQALRGAHIVLAGDNDDSGIRYMLDIRDSLRGIAASFEAVDYIAEALAARGAAL
jgi:putative DNA primase/helicase